MLNALQILSYLAAERRIMNAKQSDKRITALYARLSRDDEKEGVSAVYKIKKSFLKSSQRIISCRIPFFLCTMDSQA